LSDFCVLFVSDRRDGTVSTVTSLHGHLHSIQTRFWA